MKKAYILEKVGVEGAMLIHRRRYEGILQLGVKESTHDKIIRRETQCVGHERLLSQ